MHYLIIAVLAFGLSLMGCEGKTGPAGPSGSTGAAGPAGPAGPQGSTGPQGATGPQGETGPMGPAGADGADGADGAKGDKGDKGDPGETGPAGPAGADGATGPQGPAGADGADGATGPAGPKGDQGDQGPPVDLSTINPADLGTLLADVHHVKLIQDGDDKDGTLIFKATDNFTASDMPGKKWNPVLENGESTMIVAKAATQTEMPIIGVDFMWASKDEEVATVDDGMIEAVGTGTSEITVTAATRGIAVKFTVEVLSEVKSVKIDSPADVFYLANGESVDLEATAYDKALDKDGNVAAGSIEVGVDLTYMSSDDSVVEINGATAEAVGVGSAKITAHYGDIPSPAITINVTPGGDITHKLTYTRISAADRTFHLVRSSDGQDTAVYGPGETPAGSGGTGSASVEYTVQVRIFDSEGKAAVDTSLNNAAIDDIKIKLQPVSDVLDSAQVTVTALESGIATITVANDAVDRALSKNATARIILSYPGADDIVLPAVMVNVSEEDDE